MKNDRVAAAGRVIYKAAQQHGWAGFDEPFDMLNPVARSEFLGIVEEALRAADAVGPDFSKHKYEQPLPNPDALERAKADEDASAPFKDPRYMGIPGGGS
jgi:hypothetical protein